MKKLTALLAATTAAVLFASSPAGAWSPPVLTVVGAGCEEAQVTVYNPEPQAAKVTASNVFIIGSSVAAHGTLVVTVHGQDNFVATVTLDYPDNGTATAPVTFDKCPPSTTTPTTTPTSTTTEPGPPISIEQDTPPVEVVPHFTG